ncbi:unnamed protein product [Vitrella brassicaformis CCMP3155]|uniref:Uncharacterized protein n=1 Tax=Vitrella brassicaformis (strain CCMP3155) TaxID=1169540 RepID=A0A0G4GGS5_VITBC|nr:unnamed protein product [Vitrella brassicaformis CCMP3155]|eukprot:CEM28651.1 unnamed protein product [Vitrella brassicaformis CCMP3155]
MDLWCAQWQRAAQISIERRRRRAARAGRSSHPSPPRQQQVEGSEDSILPLAQAAARAGARGGVRPAALQMRGGAGQPFAHPVVHHQQLVHRVPSPPGGGGDGNEKEEDDCCWLCSCCRWLAACLCFKQEGATF